MNPLDFLRFESEGRLIVAVALVVFATTLFVFNRLFKGNARSAVASAAALASSVGWYLHRNGIPELETRVVASLLALVGILIVWKILVIFVRWIRHTFSYPAILR